MSESTNSTISGAWPDLASGTEPDAIDDLIADLNEAMSLTAALDGTEDRVLTFERDVLDVNRPEDWGAVEMTGATNEWADGKIIDQIYQIDIWAAVGDRASEWLARIESVLAAKGDMLRYQLTERAYLHDVKKVLWRWRAELWTLAAEETEMETEEETDDTGEGS